MDLKESLQRQSGSDGIMQIYNTRIEKCGGVELGEYCLHFHLVGDCPECQFVGNVVTHGNNKRLLQFMVLLIHWLMIILFMICVVLLFILKMEMNMKIF